MSKVGVNVFDLVLIKNVTGKAVGRRWVVDPEKGPSFNKKD
jgi:hypothetical protein